MNNLLLLFLTIGLISLACANMLLEHENKKLCNQIEKEQKNVQKLINSLSSGNTDEVNASFNKKKEEIAYKNKLELVKSKINELKYYGLHTRIAEEIAGKIIVQMADCMIEQDRLRGKLDDLYSEK